MFIASFIHTIVRYRSQLISIGKLDDRTLRDIGLNRGELRAVAWDTVAREASQ